MLPRISLARQLFHAVMAAVVLLVAVVAMGMGVGLGIRHDAGRPGRHEDQRGPIKPGRPLPTITKDKNAPTNGARLMGNKIIVK